MVSLLHCSSVLQSESFPTHSCTPTLSSLYISINYLQRLSTHGGTCWPDSGWLYSVATTRPAPFASLSAMASPSRSAAAIGAPGPAAGSLAVGETVILLHPPLPSVGASTGVVREGCSKMTVSPTVGEPEERGGGRVYDGSEPSRVRDRLCRSAHVEPSRRRDCHFTDTPSPSILKHLLTGEGGAAEWQNSRQRLGEPAVLGRAGVALLPADLAMIGEKGSSQSSRLVSSERVRKNLSIYPGSCSYIKTRRGK